MILRDLQAGDNRVFVADDALRFDVHGWLWANLDAPAEMEPEPYADLVQVRRVRQFFAKTTGLMQGPECVFEVCAEEIVHRSLKSISDPKATVWSHVLLWRPWHSTFGLSNLPVFTPIDAGCC